MNHLPVPCVLGMKHSLKLEKSMPNEFSEEPGERRWRPRFTLFHLMLIVFLVGLGSGVCLSYNNTDLFVPKYLAGKPTSGVSGCAQNVVRIGLAMEAYDGDHGHFPTSQHELVPHYLDRLPHCPTAGRMSYRTSFGPRTGYNTSDNPRYFLVECCGINHDNLWIAPDFPAYDNFSGLMMEQKI
jgi:hypothetical protein